MLCRTSWVMHTVYNSHACIMHLTWNQHGVKTWIIYKIFKFLKACFNCLDLCQTKIVNPYFMLLFIAMRLQVVDNSWIPQNRPWMTSALSTIALFQTSSALSPQVKCLPGSEFSSCSRRSWDRLADAKHGLAPEYSVLPSDATCSCLVRHWLHLRTALHFARITLHRFYIRRSWIATQHALSCNTCPWDILPRNQLHF